MSHLTAEEIKKVLKAGSIITCIRPEFSNSVHTYTLIRDNAHQESESFKLLSEAGNIMYDFESQNPLDAIAYLEGEGLRMVVKKIESPSKKLTTL